LYLWVKAFHIIAMVAWMASLLIYPRYKLHQLKSESGELLFETMKTGAAQLRSIIMIPSMIATWLLGLTLLGLNPYIIQMPFFWVKFAMVVAVTGLHLFFTKTGRAIDSGDSGISGTKLKMLNEVPFLLLIIIVVLIVVKPF